MVQRLANGQLNGRVSSDNNVANKLSVRTRIAFFARSKRSFRLVSNVHVNCTHASPFITVKVKFRYNVLLGTGKKTVRYVRGKM